VGNQTHTDKNLFVSAFRGHHGKQPIGPGLDLQFSDCTLEYTDTFFSVRVRLNCGISAPVLGSVCFITYGLT